MSATRPPTKFEGPFHEEHFDLVINKVQSLRYQLKRVQLPIPLKMPQNPSAPKKKKKGPAPAHQNKFAWTHNPKSKTTAKILTSPNIHVCRRCHDKIEWRKQYRKYKPLTQPSTCNGCKKRNVKASYHTICESCTRNSDKAKEILAAASIEAGGEGDCDHDEEDKREQSLTCILRPATRKPRVCAVCVKELALPDPDGDVDDENVLERLGRIKLRERKAIERQLEREAREARRKPKAGEEEEDDDDDGEDDSSGADYSDDEDDPFLKAVGGADKLLTGKAYQEKLLAQQAS